MLDNIGTPVLSLVTGFLKTNPVAAKAAQTFAAAPATQAFIKTISGIAIGIGPTEKAALVNLAPLSALHRNMRSLGILPGCWPPTVGVDRHSRTPAQSQVL